MSVQGSVPKYAPAQFDAAVAASKQLPERPDNMTLLKIYALFKQGSTTAIQQNDNWGSAANAAQLATVATSVGAFALPAGSVALSALPLIQLFSVLKTWPLLRGTRKPGYFKYFVFPSF